MSSEDQAADGRVTRGQETRAKLVAVATDLFGESGYEGTSTEAVLERSGASRGSLYHHFASKQDLFEAVLWQAQADLVRATIEAAVGSRDGVEALGVGCAAYLQLARDPVIRRIVLLDAPGVVGWARWREIDDEHSLAVIRSGVMAAARLGLAPAHLVDPLSHCLLATVNELALTIAYAEHPEVAERLAIETLAHILGHLFGGGIEPSLG